MIKADEIIYSTINFIMLIFGASIFVMVMMLRIEGILFGCHLGKLSTART